MKKIVLAIMLLAYALFSADNFTFEKVNNAQEVSSKKLKKKQLTRSMQSRQARSYQIYSINQFSFNENLDELTSVSNNGEHLFYLAYNKKQADPTNFLSKNLLQNYRCDYNGSQIANCDFVVYHTRVEYALNSIGGWFYFNAYPSNDNDFVLINRINAKRGNAGESYNFMRNKPHFKVFVDTYGKLGVTFTLITGGTQTVFTPEAIPLNTNVYLQANNSGINYEVGWITADGTSSRASGSHQGFAIPADIYEHTIARNSRKSCQSGPNDNSGCIEISSPFEEGNFNETIKNYKTLSKNYCMTKFFWGQGMAMFSDMNSPHPSNKFIYQTDLVIDATLINKILLDLSGTTNYFNGDELKLYIDDNYNIILIDIRACQKG